MVNMSFDQKTSSFDEDTRDEKYAWKMTKHDKGRSFMLLNDRSAEIYDNLGDEHMELTIVYWD